MGEFCQWFQQTLCGYSRTTWICGAGGIIIFILFMRFWFNRVNRLFTIQMLAEFEDDEKQSVAFVLTHPNDESFFFTPVLEILRRSQYVMQHEIKIRMLTLTRGDYTGKGSKRASELEEMCHKYNIECTVLDEEDTQDGPNFWQGNKVAEHVRKFLEEGETKLVITFDQYGADSHPNHISTFHAVNAARIKIPDLKIWALHSYGALSKYNPLFAILRAMFSRPSVIMFSPLEVIRNISLHGSQKRWYHPLYAFISSYSYANCFNAM